MSRYYQPVSEEVRSLPITCHAGTQSESGYSPSQTLTLELDGGGDVQGHAPALPLGKLGPIAIPTTLPQALLKR